MKTETKLGCFFLLAPLFCHASFTFPTDGTNVVHVVYDETLSPSTEAGLDAAPQRSLAPSLPNARVVPARAEHPAIVIPPGTIELEGVSWTFLLLNRRPTPSPALQGSGTNFTLHVSSLVSDHYQSHASLYASHVREIAEADLFQQYLSTNDWAAASSNSLCSLRLTKACAPGAMSIEHARESLQGLAGCTLFPPSPLDFEMRAIGPDASLLNRYLWGTIPVVQSGGRVIGLPIIYYRNRWWISFWFWEEGEQTW